MAEQRLTADMIPFDDEDRLARHFRNPDRPKADFGLRLKRKPKPPEEKRYEGRVRTASWRNRNDIQGRPESADIGRALLIALTMSPDLDARLDNEDLYLTAVALELLDQCGFSRDSVKDAIKRFRVRVRAGRSSVREAQDVRMRAFDEFVERAAARAEADGYMNEHKATVGD
jgi:hypothetical protein